MPPRVEARARVGIVGEALQQRAHGVQPAVEKKGAGRGFDRILHHGVGDFHAVAYAQHLVEAGLVAPGAEIAAADQFGAFDGHEALVGFGVFTVKGFADQQTQSGVAEELEAFVVHARVRPAGPGALREGQAQQLGIAELIAGALLQAVGELPELLWPVFSVHPFTSFR